MATFSPTDVHRYLTALSFPSPATPPPPTLSTLTHLISLHTTHIPFENLSFHYFPTTRSRPVPSLSPHDLLSKILSHRGGYCMELSTPFSTLLRTLGFTLHTIGARAHLSVSSGNSKAEGWGGWDHMAIIVTLGPEGKQYLVDVGFGGNGPVLPVPIEEGVEVGGMGGQRHRVIKRNEERRGVDGGWVLEIGDWEEPEVEICPDGVNGQSKGKVWKWKPGYLFFPTIEFLPADYAIMNHATQNPELATFSGFLFAVRMLRGEEVRRLVEKEGMEEEGVDWREVEKVGGRPQGKVVVVDGKLKVRLGDRIKVMEEFKSEERRAETLRLWFGVDVRSEWMGGYSLEIVGEERAEGKVQAAETVEA